MKINLSTRIKTIVVFTLCILPCLYLFLLAEDRFQSASHFSVVVEEDNNAEASMGLLDLVGTAPGAANDSQIVIGFINSSDLLFDLETKFKLIEHYTGPSTDFIFCMHHGATKDERINYYRKKIHAHLDIQSGLIHLTVETYSPKLSAELSDYILSRTEQFINDLNKEVANKRLSFAQGELKRAHINIKKDEAALITFQNKSKVIQPDAIIRDQLEAIQTLRLEKINQGIQLATIEASSPNAPTKQSLKTAISHLDTEIKEQEAALSGDDAKKLNQILAKYKELQLNLELSLALRKGAELILEKTRAEATATSRFFSVVQHPYISDESSHPRRLYLSITSAIVILLILFIARALITSIYDRV